jgi:threonine dehydrogenase-like Zn-dependent dehydrogenase
MRMFGNHIDGAYAEHVLAPARDLFRLPAAIPLEEGCVIADAFSTPFHAVKNRGRVRPGDTVAVVGVGGVGLNVVQIAAAAGARVIAVDQRAERLALARRLGAFETVDAGDGPADRADRTVRDLTGGGVDVAFEVVGRAATLEAAFGMVRRGGRLCVIGFSPESPAWPAAKVMFHELEVVGSLGCRPVDYPPLIEMVAAGRLQLAPVVTGRFPLEQVNDALDACRQGRGVRNLVLP